MSEYGYIPEAPEQSFGNNKGIFNPKDIYDLTRADKYTNYGQLELIETKTGSGVSAIDFTDIKEDIYNVHFVTIVASINNTGSVQIRFFQNGVVETATVYQVAYQNGQATGTFDDNRHTTETRLYATRTGTADVLTELPKKNCMPSTALVCVKTAPPALPLNFGVLTI